MLTRYAHKIRFVYARYNGTEICRQEARQTSSIREIKGLVLDSGHGHMIVMLCD